MLPSAKPRNKGNISSVFAQLGASTSTLDPRYQSLKQEIAPKGSGILQDAYHRLLNSIEKEKQEIQEKGSAVVPEVSMDAIKNNGGRIPDDVAALIKKRGALVVRGLVDRQVAMGYKKDIEEYIKAHRDQLVGYPEDNPQVWELYWTKAQVAARANENFRIASLALNRLWYAHPDSPVDLTKQLTYCDRLRIREPGDSSFALAEHVDGGSLERWEDPEYRKCYEEIFKGRWENYDPFNVTHRINAEVDLYQGNGACTILRLYQGWIALSDVTPGGATLRVNPLIKETTAYYMMKPLLEQYKDRADFLTAWPGRSLDITKEHHSAIVDCMVSVPPVSPGDGVFWHCDQVHAVEPKNEMKTDSSVLYIPVMPLCERNSEYLYRQRDAFLKGCTPPDFPGNDCEVDIMDRATVDTTDDDNVKIGMGLAPFPLDSQAALTPGQLEALKQHNDRFGF